MGVAAIGHFDKKRESWFRWADGVRLLCPGLVTNGSWCWLRGQCIEVDLALAERNRELAGRGQVQTAPACERGIAQRDQED